jgi:hypothetical protein
MHSRFRTSCQLGPCKGTFRADEVVLLPQERASFVDWLQHSVRLCVKSFLAISAVAIGDLFPGLINIVEGLFRLCCAREVAGCTPVQPLVTLKKAFFLFAMNARKSYAASFLLDSCEITQCQLPPFVFPTVFSELFSHWFVSGLNASVVPGIIAAPTRPCTLERARSRASRDT